MVIVERIDADSTRYILEGGGSRVIRDDWLLFLYGSMQQKSVGAIRDEVILEGGMFSLALLKGN